MTSNKFLYVSFMIRFCILFGHYPEFKHKNNSGSRERTIHEPHHEKTCLWGLPPG